MHVIPKRPHPQQNGKKAISTIFDRLVTLHLRPSAKLQYRPLHPARKLIPQPKLRLSAFSPLTYSFEPLGYAELILPHRSRHATAHFPIRQTLPNTPPRPDAEGAEGRARGFD